MTAKYYAILTNQGAAKLATATALGTQLNITQMAVGDGNGSLPTPNATQTKLVNQTRIAALNLLTLDANNTNQIIAEQIIPENEGGFWIREMGLYDDAGVLIAVSNCPETYKPLLLEGSARTQTIRMVLTISNTQAITLKVDPTVVLATRKYADDLMNNHVKEANPHSQYLQIAQSFKEITDAGSDAVAAALKNLGLGEAAKRGVGTGANQLPDMNSFGNSLANTGYQKLPGGLIIQWGFTSSGLAGNTVTLPVAFKSSIAGCAGCESGDDTSIKVVSVIPKSLSTIKVSGRVTGANTLANTSVRWIVIGY